MRYKDYEGTAEKLVCSILREIEEKEHVRIIYAVESGSRAWGFASPDSDYDVRFVYTRSMEHYLSLREKKDFINWRLDETLDITGWDLSKVLQHFHKSNATLFEWANSPIVYKTTPEWMQVMEVANSYFSCKSAMYHYYGTARKNYSEYLMDDTVKYKKYFYVLRPILACKWIDMRLCPPPVLFRELSDEMLEADMGPVVDWLVQIKMQMAETEKGKRIDKLNDYIEEKLAFYKHKVEGMQDDRKSGWEELDRLFVKMLKNLSFRKQS